MGHRAIYVYMEGTDWAQLICRGPSPSGPISGYGGPGPISLLSVFDKILEKLMYTRLHSYLRDKDILYDYQFGFRRHHFTCFKLLTKSTNT